jgi:hypothetical protein
MLCCAVCYLPCSCPSLNAAVCRCAEYALNRKIRELEEVSLAPCASPLRTPSSGGSGGELSTHEEEEEEGEEEEDRSRVLSSNGRGGDHGESMCRVSEYIDDMDSDDEELTVQIIFSDFEEAVKHTKLSLSADDYANYTTQ